MKQIRKFGIWGLIATLSLTLLGSVSGSVLAQKKDKGKTEKPAEKGVVKQVVLVFPPDTKGGVTNELTDAISEVVQGRLGTSGKYRSVLFLTSMPTIRRALNEQTLSAQDVKGPFDDDAKLKRLVPLTGYKWVFVSSIADYQYNSAKRVVELVMSVRLIDYSTEKPAIRSAASSLKSGENAPAGSTESQIAQKVARDLTEQLMTDLLKPAEKK